MKIVIIGIGTIGETILKSLSLEEHTITIVDENKEIVERLIEKYDVFGVVGNGARMDIQIEANVGNADLVIALTGNDELNIFACLVAKRLGVSNTIARVRNPDYRRQIEEMKDALGISMVVNPEKEMANEIFNLISLPSVVRIERFAKGKVLLVEVTVAKGCRMIDETLVTLGKKLNSQFLICAVQRGERVIIPSGNFIIREGDKLHFTADTRNIIDFLTEVNLAPMPMKNIMIAGGGKTGFYLADALAQKNYSVKLIESDPAKADELAEELPDVTVICGNGTQHDLLIEEGIERMDAFVALTDIDEENIIVSMFADGKRVKKTITRIESDDLYGMMDALGTKDNVSPKRLVANRVIGYVRALGNSRGNNILTMYPLVDNRVEALEFSAKAHESIYNIPLKNLQIKENCLIACIIRKNEVIIPNGSTKIRFGDTVVVVTTHKNFDDLTDAFK